MQDRGSNTIWWIFGSVLVIGCLCLSALACVVVGGLLLGFPVFQNRTVATSVPLPPIITVEVQPQKPTEPQPSIDNTPDSSLPTSTPSAQDGTDPELSAAEETLRVLQEETIPVNDPIELARRMERKTNLPVQIESAPPDLDPGARETFWVMDSDMNRAFQVEAVLRYETPHLYFWIEDGVQYDPGELQQLAETFEAEIYPTNREFFGTEWTPGVDNDPHLYVVMAGGTGSSVAGYFASRDSYSPEVNEHSNAHEMFVLNADNTDLGDWYTYATLAHEFQHMIQYYQDRNEESWVSEGFSELAQILNGYDNGNMDYAYAADPDLQLNTWPNIEDSGPHYGASFLFMTYFLDRFGEEATKAVVAHPDNGLDSFDSVLQSFNAVDPRTGKEIGANDVFADWVVATFLNDAAVGDGRYVYRGYPNPAQPDLTEIVWDCETEPQARTVRQYGVDYIELGCSGVYTLHFEGDPVVGVLPVNAYSGAYAFWSNRGDESNMALEREFDLTGATGPLTFVYQTWYDIEADYDYVYLLASEDGETWQFLQTPSGTGENPVGSNYGWGYSGQSADWIEERVDLSAYAGKKVRLRFEYVTDAAVNTNGFFVDDVRIPEIGYSEDFEVGEGGWQGEGFVRLQNSLPQTFAISVLRDGRGTTVETVHLEPGQSASIPIEVGGDVDRVVLVVSGTTRFTTQTANYRVWFTR